MKVTIISTLLLLVCVVGIIVSIAVHKDTHAIGELTYTTINETPYDHENPNPPLDYQEIERPQNQEEILGAPDEIGIPQYTPSDSFD